jgi:NADPH-dependent curcumin reductase CurA
MYPIMNRQAVLAVAPVGRLHVDHVKTISAAISARAADEVLVRVIYAQIASGTRAIMTHTTPFPMTIIGQPVFAAVVGEVIDGPAVGPAPGTMVTGFGGWAEYVLIPLAGVRPVSVETPLHHHVGVLGHNGLAAYFGMLSVSEAKTDETVVVSAAAGGVGHIAGQLARIAGARVIGITGSAAKNRVLEDELGFSATINRRSPTFASELQATCRDGVDVYFDNVGNPLLDKILPLMADHGRVVCCGAVASYDGVDDNVKIPGPHGIPQLIINKALRMQGILTSDFVRKWNHALEQLAAWTRDGVLIPVTKIWDGLDNAPQALVSMLAGDNLGQVVVQVGSEPS